MSVVIWKEIEGYEGLYRVGTNGQVKSMERMVDNGRGGKMKIQEKILKPTPDGHGYLQVNLSKDGKEKKHKVHRLVGETFLENFENKETINHMDGNKENNNMWNLFWATNKENIAHAHENGLGAGKHLSDEEAETVRSMYQAGGITKKELADQFGVSQKTISNVIHRKRAYAEKPKPIPPRNTFPGWEKYV